MILQVTLAPSSNGQEPKDEERKKLKLPPIGLTGEVDQAISRVVYEVRKQLWLERHCPFA